MEVKIIYSDRKTVGISVKMGALTVRAPRNMTEKEISVILQKHKKWITGALERDRKKQELYGSLDEKGIKKLRSQARAYFAEKTNYYAKLMELTYKKVRITSSKTRFGSCSSLGNINFSYRLMLYPELAREYVIVHELSHLKEMNHSPRFYKIVEKYMPDYKERRAMLKIDNI